MLTLQDIIIYNIIYSEIWLIAMIRISLVVAGLWQGTRNPDMTCFDFSKGLTIVAGTRQPE